MSNIRTTVFDSTVPIKIKRQQRYVCVVEGAAQARLLTVVARKHIVGETARQDWLVTEGSLRLLVESPPF